MIHWLKCSNTLLTKLLFSVELLIDLSYLIVLSPRKAPQPDGERWSHSDQLSYQGKQMDTYSRVWENWVSSYSKSLSIWHRTFSIFYHPENDRITAGVCGISLNISVVHTWKSAKIIAYKRSHNLDILKSFFCWLLHIQLLQLNIGIFIIILKCYFN